MMQTYKKRKIAKCALLFLLTLALLVGAAASISALAANPPAGGYPPAGGLANGVYTFQNCRSNDYMRPNGTGDNRELETDE